MPHTQRFIFQFSFFFYFRLLPYLSVFLQKKLRDALQGRRVAIFLPFSYKYAKITLKTDPFKEYLIKIYTFGCYSGLYSSMKDKNEQMGVIFYSC
jgi:hypothetical protein